MASTRPQSSLSQRSTSRMSQRPVSRVSGRAIAASRHAARMAQLTQLLVSQVSGQTLLGDPESFSRLHELALRTLETRQGASETIEGVSRRIRGIAKRARINAHDNVGNALEKSWTQLQQIAGHLDDNNSDIKESNLPDLLQFLLEISSPPVASTIVHADIVLSSDRGRIEQEPTLTWKQIMAEEPFEGEHWNSVFATGAQLSSSEEEEDDSDSEETSVIDESVSSVSPQASHIVVPTTQSTQTEYFFGSSIRNREVIEELRAKQYWRPEWKIDAKWERQFQLADPSTLASSLTSSRAPRAALINEVDAVRDVLLLIQGFNTSLTKFELDSYGDPTQAKILPNAPRLLHISQEAYHSLLSTFCTTATKLQETRYFIQSVYSSTITRRCKTLEAFTAAIDECIIRNIGNWCAELDEAITRGQQGLGRQLVISLLNCSQKLDERMSSSLDVIHSLLSTIGGTSSGWIRVSTFAKFHPSHLSSLVLDGLLDAIHMQLAIGDASTASNLIQIFAASSEPIWRSVGQWVKDGMNITVSNDLSDHEIYVPSDPELFIERKEDLSYVDPGFWESGYTLRCLQEEEDHLGEGSPSESSGHVLVPRIFESLAQDVLSCGKATGLLRALGVDPYHSEIDLQWKSFRDSSNRSQEIVASETTESPDPTTLLRLSLDVLDLTLKDQVAPWCTLAHEHLRVILVEDCQLWKHLNCVEDLLLMRRGDALGMFCDKVFAKMDSGTPWTDLHFLNNAISELATLDGRRWIDPSLVQFFYSFRGGANISSSVKVFEGLSIEYSVPFPLTYLFSRPSSTVYSSIFVLFMQIHRVKSIVDSSVLRASKGSLPNSEEEIAVLVVRAKLVWFINTLLNFLMNYVVDIEVKKLHTNLESAKSLEDMISVYDKHLDTLQTQCLLKSKMAALRRAIASILDLAIQFVHSYDVRATTRDRDEDGSRISISKKRRRRRGRKASNVIGFTSEKALSEDSSSSSSDDGADVGTEEDQLDRPSLAASISFAQESFGVQVERISEELDGSVRFLKRSMESLAAGTSEASSKFAVLSFMLEEWDS